MTVVVAGLGVAVPGTEARLCLSPARRGWLSNSHVRPWELRVFDCSSPDHAWSLTAAVFGPGMEGAFLTWSQIWGQGPWLQQDLRNALARRPRFPSQGRKGERKPPLKGCLFSLELEKVA